jgi:hypothetical protein
MRNQYLPYNPVFESLYSQANKYSNPGIYEQTGKELSLDKVEKYAKDIITGMVSKVLYFAIQSPTSISGEIKKMLGEEVPKLSENASLQDLVNATENIWKKCYAEAQKSKQKDLIMPYYDKVSEGIESLKKSWEGLKNLAGESGIQNNDILEATNSLVSELIKSTTDELEKAKKTINNSK